MPLPFLRLNNLTCFYLLQINKLDFNDKILIQIKKIFLIYLFPPTKDQICFHEKIGPVEHCFLYVKLKEAFKVRYKFIYNNHIGKIYQCTFPSCSIVSKYQTAIWRHEHSHDFTNLQKNKTRNACWNRKMSENLQKNFFNQTMMMISIPLKQFNTFLLYPNTKNRFMHSN